MASELTVDIDGHVAVLEIHRPPVNYFDRTILKEIADTAAELEAGNHVRALVLCSEGKHFCAGANFGGGELLTPEDRGGHSRKLYTEGIRVFEIKLPVIAAVQGSAVGGGLGLACAADFRVATSASRFHANFSSLGFHHGFGLSVTLPRIVGQQKALDLLYTSRRITGQEAFEMGLADRLADDGKEREVAVTWAHEIAAMGPQAVKSIKETMRAPMAAEVRVALERELHEQSWLWETEDSKVAIAANLAREKPVFSGK
ncbi:enoyl-CoA hydratase/isomerase family protein [soil metagenome]